MTSDQPLSDRQLEQLAAAVQRGAGACAAALSGWFGAALSISVERIGQVPLQDAARLLGSGDSAVCACLMSMEGGLTGQMLLGFEDASGLILADLILQRASGTATEWGDVEESAALETMNIAGSAFLNGIAEYLAGRVGRDLSLIPAPPIFLRDFAECLLQSAFMCQAMDASVLLFAETLFVLAGQPLSWTFLWIPDSESLRQLGVMLDGLSS